MFGPGLTGVPAVKIECREHNGAICHSKKLLLHHGIVCAPARQIFHSTLLRKVHPLPLIMFKNKHVVYTLGDKNWWTTVVSAFIALYYSVVFSCDSVHAAAFCSTSDSFADDVMVFCVSPFTERLRACTAFLRWMCEMGKIYICVNNVPAAVKSSARDGSRWCFISTTSRPRAHALSAAARNLSKRTRRGWVHDIYF